MITVLHMDEQNGFRGGEQQAAWLIRGLTGYGVRNILAGRRNAPFLALYPELDRILRIALPLAGEFDLYSAFRLARLAVASRVDIIHAHTSHAHGIAALALFLGAPCRLVVSRRVNFLPKGNFLNRWKYDRADRILCVSQTVHDTMARFGFGTPQLHTVHSAVDQERALMPPVSRHSLDIPENIPFLFSAGSLVEHKDHANLLRAFVQVRATFPDARLCIAGDGPLLANLKAQCSSLGLGASVSFLGYRADAPGICRNADLYVSSSSSEGLGTSILEALASGTPVVATEAGGAREMIIPEETGMLVPTGDSAALANAIVHSLKYREKALQMAERGKLHVKDHFSVDRMVTDTLNIYRELAAETSCKK